MVSEVSGSSVVKPEGYDHTNRCCCQLRMLLALSLSAFIAAGAANNRSNHDVMKTRAIAHAICTSLTIPYLVKFKREYDL